VLRRDAPHVVQRHDLDRHRRDRAGRGLLPDLLAHPRQHEARQGTLGPGDRGAPLRPHPRVQPARLRRRDRGEGQPGRPLGLAAGLPVRSPRRRSRDGRGRVDLREHEHLRLPGVRF
jgi:hypothetical protein